MTYVVGVDIGAAFTAAAIGRPIDGVSALMPSIGYYPSHGHLVFGPAARHQGLADPDRIVREFHRRIGDPVPVAVGDALLAAEDITAQAVRHVIDRAQEAEGGPAERVIVTHPAAWGSYKTAALMSALQRAGLGQVGVLSQAVAAGSTCAKRVKSG